MLFSFVLAISALCAVPCAAQQPAAPITCTTSYVRREIRDLSAPERTRLFNAMKKLNTGARPTIWDRFANIHLQGQGVFHGGPMFLPWHRMMLKRFEQELQKVDPGVVLAYWDWSLDYNQPHRSVVLSNEYLGGNSQGGCVKDGQFANWQVSYPTSHCLTRQYAGGAQGIGPFTSNIVLEAIIDQSEEYEDFRQQIESIPHSGPHTGVGGDLATMQSPNDPIFYFHHGYIDKLWYDWQQQDQSRVREYYGVNRDGSKALISNQLPFMNASVRDALNARSLCYSYAPARSANRLQRRSGGAKEAAQENSVSNDVEAAMNPNLHLPTFNTKLAQCAAKKLKEEIRHPEPVPKCWIDMNGYCEKDIRRMEDAYRCIVNEANEVYRKLHPKNEAESAY
jgi:tyrosinase